VIVPADRLVFPATAPKPRRVQLPLGGSADFFTREQMTVLYGCSHGELGRLLCRQQAPLPVRVDGAILWYVDESLGSMATVMRTLERWRHR
jgi:hypothetical protein